MLGVRWWVLPVVAHGQRAMTSSSVRRVRCSGNTTFSIICPITPSARIMAGLRYLKARSKAIPTKSAISCTDAGHEKPDPYCLNKIIAESGKAKSEFIYFGDSKTDYEFAKAAGIDFLIVDHYLNEKKFYKMMLELFV